MNLRCLEINGITEEGYFHLTEILGIEFIIFSRPVSLLIGFMNGNAALELPVVYDAYFWKMQDGGGSLEHNLLKTFQKVSSYHAYHNSDELK